MALRILREVGRGRRLDLSFGQAARELPPGQAPRLQELVYGTVRLRGRIDHLLDHQLHRGVASVAPPLLDLLRLGAYELLYMEVPAYAAVSQAAAQAREVGGRRGASLVNGVLRALARAGETSDIFPSFQEDPAGLLSTWGSHPRWLVERWLERWSPEQVRELVDANNRPPPLYLRPLRITVDEAMDRLRARGVDAQVVPHAEMCIRVDGGGSPGDLVEWVEGIVQDPAAALVTEYAAFPAGARVADLCAAPGGKALAMAGSGLRVLAADRSLARLRLVREGSRRLGLPLVLVAALAEASPFREVDAVLLDVPCTGTGTLARHPDARWRLEPEDISSLAAVQARILKGAAGMVPPGGLLVYSTCTMEREENERQVEAFLRDHPTFRPDPGSNVPDRYRDRDGWLHLLPHRGGFDGAFAARLRRNG